MHHWQDCLLLGVTILWVSSITGLFFAIPAFKVSRGSVYAETQCLITEISVTSIPGNYYTCHHVVWSFNASLGDAPNTMHSGCLTNKREISQCKALYKIGSFYPCFAQIGNNTAAPAFVWPGNELINLPPDRVPGLAVAIALCVIVAFAGACFFIYLFVAMKRAREIGSDTTILEPLKESK